MRQDIILKPWQIELTTNSTNDSFEESTFFTGNGRMGIRGYLPFWQEKRTFETGLFVAGIFGEIKPGITDFVNLPTPVWGNIECDGHPITLSSPVSSTLDMKTGVRSQSFLAKSGETTLNIEHQVFCSMSDPSLPYSGFLSPHHAPPISRYMQEFILLVATALFRMIR